MQIISDKTLNGRLYKAFLEQKGNPIKKLGKGCEQTFTKKGIQVVVTTRKDDVTMEMSVKSTMLYFTSKVTIRLSFCSLLHVDYVILLVAEGNRYWKRCEKVDPFYIAVDM